MRFRLRTALIAVAVLSPPLACVAAVARHGGFGPFRRHHASLFNAYSFHADRCRHAVDTYRRHRAPGHSCPMCCRYDRPIAVLIAEEQRHQREYGRRIGVNSVSFPTLALAGPRGFGTALHSRHLQEIRRARQVSS
jgi:hypothetical protein